MDRLWNDGDFTSLKLENCGVDVEVLAREKKEKSFRDWKEGRHEVERKKKRWSQQLFLSVRTVELNGMTQMTMTDFSCPVQQ